MKTTLAGTMGSDSRMRADNLHRSHRESQGMLQYTRVGTSRLYTRSPYGPSLGVLVIVAI